MNNGLSNTSSRAVQRQAQPNIVTVDRFLRAASVGSAPNKSSTNDVAARRRTKGSNPSRASSSRKKPSSSFSKPKHNTLAHRLAEIARIRIPDPVDNNDSKANNGSDPPRNTLTFLHTYEEDLSRPGHGGLGPVLKTGRVVFPSSRSGSSKQASRVPSTSIASISANKRKLEGEMRPVTQWLKELGPTLAPPGTETTTKAKSKPKRSKLRHKPLAFPTLKRLESDEQTKQTRRLTIPPRTALRAAPIPFSLKALPFISPAVPPAQDDEDVEDIVEDDPPRVVVPTSPEEEVEDIEDTDALESSSAHSEQLSTNASPSPGVDTFRSERKTCDKIGNNAGDQNPPNLSSLSALHQQINQPRKVSTPAVTSILKRVCSETEKCDEARPRKKVRFE